MNLEQFTYWKYAQTVLEGHFVRTKKLMFSCQIESAASRPAHARPHAYFYIILGQKNFGYHLKDFVKMWQFCPKKPERDESDKTPIHPFLSVEF